MRPHKQPLNSRAAELDTAPAATEPRRVLLMIPALLGLSAALFPPSLQEDEPQAGFALRFPAGPAAEGWSQVDIETTPAELPSEWEELLVPGTWSYAGTWSRWLELLAAERDAAALDPARRALLAYLAMEHGRSEDAWRYFESLAEHPAWSAALAARLWLGREVVPTAGGEPATLPQGVLLTPRLPPGSSIASGAGLIWREAKIHGLRIGQTRLSMRIAVERDGVQVDLRHLSGPSAKLQVLLPVPLGYERQIEYVDWAKQETLGVPHVVELEPDSEKLSLWVRFLPGELALPAVIPPSGATELPAMLREGGLWLVDRAESPDGSQPLMQALAEGLGPLFSIETHLLSPSPRGAISGTGTVVQVPAGAQREAFLALLASAIEARVLPADSTARSR